MSGPVRAAALAAAVWECDRHRAALGEALTDWHALPTITADALDRDSTLRRLTDQILYLFSKLQDAMGERLVPATLGSLQEPHEAWPMRDRLDRLEKLGYLDAENWLAWCDVRNRLEHEYPDAAALRQTTVLAAVQASSQLVHAWLHWKSRLTQVGA